MHRFKSSALGAFVALVVVGAGQSSPVLAQDAAASPAAAPEAAPAAAEPTAAPAAQAESAPQPSAAALPVQETPASAAADVPELQEVIVTARKRSESIQDVPLSVTAFSAEEMEQRGFSGLDDIAASTPGFTFESFGTGGAHGNAVIRGLSQQFTTTRIQNVSFFLDGVYLQRQSMLNLGLIDMQRVEVVKGPQNALYGRNAFAGAVNYVTLQPTDEVTGYVTAGLGDNERREFRGSISGPITSDGKWLGKLTFGKSDYDGHTVNDHPVKDAPVPGDHLTGNLGGYDDGIYSAMLVYKPSEFLRVGGSFFRSDQVQEAAPTYSLSGVNAARFGLRFDDQNDLNCNSASVADIQPYPPRTHTGFTAFCGELPRYASDVAPRTMPGIIIDPRALGTVAKTNLATLTADYDFNADLSLHYLFGYANHSSLTDGGASDEDPLAGRGINTNALLTQVDNQNPLAYQFVNTASARPNTLLNSFSSELRLDWQFSPALRTSFGTYFSETEDEEWTVLFLNDLCNADPANIANCSQTLDTPNHLAQNTVLTAAAAWDQYTRQHAKEKAEYTIYKDRVMAGFASASYQFTPTLDGTLEGRVTMEDKAVRRLTDSFAVPAGQGICYGATCPNSVPPPACTPTMNDITAPVLAVANTLCSGINKAEDAATFIDFTPRAILNWKWAEDNMVYLSAAKGVKAGGFNNAATEAELTYDPEENWTYELGSKNRFFHFITLNAAMYYVDQTTLQGGVPPAVAGLSTSDIITNIGGATSLGIEIEGSAALTREFSVDTGLTFSDPRYTEGTKFSGGKQTTGSVHCNGTVCPIDGDISGNQLSRTSKVQASFGLNYVTRLIGWTSAARLDVNYQSRQFVEPLNLAWVPARTLTNASLNFGSPGRRWEMNFWAKNLTDEDYPAASFFIGVFNQYLVSKGARRQFGASLKYNFY